RFQRALEFELCLAVDVDWLLRMIFCDRHLNRSTVGRAGRRENNMPYAMVFHCRQQIHSSNDVCLPIELRFFRRLADQGLSREVKNAVDPAIPEIFLEIGEAADVAFEGRRLLNKRSMSGGEIVEYDRFQACGFQGLYRMTADVTGAAGDKNHET